MSKILEVKDLSVTFTDTKKNKKQVLFDVDFEMEAGEILGLAGESGSGKSTIAKCILGMIPHQGEIHLEDKNPQMIFQDPYSSLNPAKTIRSILEEPLKLHTKLSREERLIKVKEALESVELSSELMVRKPSELSGGQRQRVCIAESLINDTKFLIADEPVSALDVTVQAQILKLLINLKEKKGLTILFISHDLRTMYNVCDRIMILDKGYIVESGTPKEMYSNPKHDYTKLLLKSAGLNTFKDK